MEYGPVPESKYDNVIFHLRYHFADEPLNVAVGLCHEGVECKLIEHYDSYTLREGFSVMAYDSKNDKIAGVALNGISQRGELKAEIEKTKSIDSIEYRRIFGLLQQTNLSIDLFTKYNVDKIFEIRILSVDSNYRGQGLAKKLFQRSILIAEEHGFQLIKVDATSYFTQKIAESFGFVVEKTIVYKEYKDEFGFVYNTKSPHDTYQVMVKQVNTKTN